MTAFAAPLRRAMGAAGLWVALAEAKITLSGGVHTEYFAGDVRRDLERESLNHDSYDLQEPVARNGIGTYRDGGLPPSLYRDGRPVRNMHAHAINEHPSTPEEQLFPAPPLPADETENPHKNDAAACALGHVNEKGKCMKVETVYEKIMRGESGMSYDNAPVVHKWTKFGILPMVFGIGSGLDAIRSHLLAPASVASASHVYQLLAERLDAVDTRSAFDETAWKEMAYAGISASTKTEDKVPAAALGLREEKTQPKKYHALFHGFTQVGGMPEVESDKGFMKSSEEPAMKSKWGTVYWANDEKRYLVATFETASGCVESATVETCTVSTVLLRRADGGDARSLDGAKAHFAFRWDPTAPELKNLNTQWRNVDITFDGIEVYDHSEVPTVSDEL